MRITREVEVEIDVGEVLEEADDEELITELEQRRKAPPSCSNVSLLVIFEEFQRRGDAPQCLKDYLYDMLGRILP